MIKVSIKQENNIISNIVISGHSLYDEYGKDIVCASVSSIVTTTINAIIRLEETIEYTNNDGYVNINILKHTKLTDTLITNMLELLKDLEKQYKNNIKIN